MDALLEDKKIFFEEFRWHESIYPITTSIIPFCLNKVVGYA
jgi:hypothetical protein